MYRCDNCQKNVGPHVSRSANTRITELRSKTYYNGAEGKTPFVSKGYEIVREESFCNECLVFLDSSRAMQ